ncbi:hypothetical protein D3C71_1662300 [compost metagenome]
MRGVQQLTAAVIDAEPDEIPDRRNIEALQIQIPQPLAELELGLIAHGQIGVDIVDIVLTVVGSQQQIPLAVQIVIHVLLNLPDDLEAGCLHIGRHGLVGNVEGRHPDCGNTDEDNHQIA